MKTPNFPRFMNRFHFTMSTSLRSLLLSSVLVSFFLLSSAQSCLKYNFAENKSFQYCNDLPYLNSYIHYTYNSTKGCLTLAYRHTGIKNPSTWVAWAINPTQTGMQNAQAFVALPRGDGSLFAYTHNLVGERPTLLGNPITVLYSNLSATYANDEIVIFVTIILPENKTNINQIWQEGDVINEIPAIHDTALPNMMSRGTLDVLLGRSTVNQTVPVNAMQKRENLHATFNVVGWGVMMPIGIMLGRYLKVIESADKIWFYMHVIWQSIAYIVGVTGWVLGIQIGSTIRRSKNQMHRALGYTLFFIATLQVMVLFLRPKKDHKYRHYWNIYHKAVGSSIVIISIINIFIGFGILEPVQKWMREYLGAIFVLFLIGIFLEVYTQQIKERRNQRIGIVKQPHIQLGFNTNGYEGRDRFGI